MSTEAGRVQSPCLYGRDPKDCSACQEAEAICAERRVVIGPTRTPEPHQLGEFPMTCYRCHIEADS